MYHTNLSWQLATLIVLGAAGLALSMPAPPSICAWNPPVLVEAGSALSALIDIPGGARCQSSLLFDDERYLPINWSFDSISCAGNEEARLVLPQELPNGNAFVIWQCARQLPALCIHVEISGGSNMPDTIPQNLQGEVGCVSDIVTTASTLTTRTNGDTTVVETVPTVFTLETTSIQTAEASLSSGNTVTTLTMLSTRTDGDTTTVETVSTVFTLGSGIQTAMSPTSPSSTKANSTLPTATITSGTTETDPTATGRTTPTIANGESPLSTHPPSWATTILTTMTTLTVTNIISSCSSRCTMPGS